ncbi:unnamed protein product [Malus baccata var. baccata]
MGVFVKIIDGFLFVNFAMAAVCAVLIDTQLCLPPSLFPSSVVEIKNWYAREFDDYLVEQKPHFLVGLIWVELILQWPLLVANLYAILTAKPWFNTTCLVYGVSFFTTMGAVLTEMLRSGKASKKMLNVHYAAMGLAVLSILRGLLPPSAAATPTSGKGITKRTDPQKKTM